MKRAEDKGMRWRVTMTKDDRELFVYPFELSASRAEARAVEIYPGWTVTASVDVADLEEIPADNTDGGDAKAE